MKLLVALGGDAINQAGQASMTGEWSADCDEVAWQLAALISLFGPDGWLAITRGNGPQSGSMGPRMASASKFVQDGGARAIVGSLDKAVDALAGKTDSRIVPDAPARRYRAPRKRHAVSLQ